MVSLGRHENVSYAGGGHFIVREGEWDDERIGVINSSGSEVVPLGLYDEILTVPGNRFIVRSGTRDDARFAVIDQAGNEVIPMGRYDEIRPLHWGGWAPPNFEIVYDYGFIVRNGDRYGVLGLDGEEIIPMGRYDSVLSIHNGIAIIQDRDRVGVINTRRIGE